MGPSGDHPRVCGEKVRRDAPAGGAVGSPPRMRGKAKELPPRQCYLGITPAYAGKSVCRWSRVDPSWDHPRVCGEKHVLRTSKQKSGGSPPRMRGKGADQTTRRVFPGITPAYAGKSGFVPNAYSSSRDHPRVCGEKIPLLISSSSIAGSPPRMRGKAWADYRMKPNRGITPAYAGKRYGTMDIIQASGDHPRVCGEKTKKIPSHRPFQLHPVPVSFSFA